MVETGHMRCCQRMLGVFMCADPIDVLNKYSRIELADQRSVIRAEPLIDFFKLRFIGQRPGIDRFYFGEFDDSDLLHTIIRIPFSSRHLATINYAVAEQDNKITEFFRKMFQTIYDALAICEQILHQLVKLCGFFPMRIVPGLFKPI